MLRAPLATLCDELPMREVRYSVRKLEMAPEEWWVHKQSRDWVLALCDPEVPGTTPLEVEFGLLLRSCCHPQVTVMMMIKKRRRRRRRRRIMRRPTATATRGLAPTGHHLRPRTDSRLIFTP
jgi:hypothetical protein